MDSGAKMCLFNNKLLLEHITTSPFNKKQVHGIHKHKYCYQKGSLSSKLKNLPLPKDNYYYEPDSMDNLLSLALISETNCVYMDTSITNAFYVFYQEGKYLYFHLCRATNLYRLDIEETTEGGCIFTTVTGCEATEQRKAALQETGILQLDYNQTEKVQDLQQVLMCPRDEDLSNAIENNVIGNKSFTYQDVVNVNKLFWSDIAALKGKTVRRKSKLPREDATIDVPQAIVDQFKEGTTLSIDIMHVNKVSFLVSKAYHLNYYQCIPI